MIDETQDTLSSAISAALDQQGSGSTGAESGQQTDAGQQPFGQQTAPAGIQPQQAAPEYQPIEAPAFWKPAAQEAWRAIQSHKDFGPHYKTIHEQWQDTQRNFTQHQQQLAAMRQQYEPVGQLISPYVQKWAQDGLGPVEGLRQVLGWRDALESDPQGTILALAQRLGVDLQQATQEQPWVDPATQALQDRLNQTEARLRQFEETGIQQQQQAVLSQVEAFRTQTDQQGNLLHPFLDQTVLQDMIHFYQSGRARDPETAYRMAVQYSPEYQQHAAAEADRQARDLAAQQQQRAARAAQIAGKGPTGSAGAIPGKSGPGSLREAINQALGD